MIPPSAILPKNQTITPLKPIEGLKRTGLATSAKPTRAIRFGNGDEKPGILKTLTTLASHLNKPGNKEYLKGYAIKYGPDVALPAVFSIPVVGWILGIPGIFAAKWANNKGGKLINEAIAKDSNKNNPFTNLIHMSDTWSGKWSEIKKQKNKEILDVLADQYDDFVKNLLPDDHDAKLRKSLLIGSEKKSSKVYGFLKDLVNAKLALAKSFFRHFSKPFDLIHNGLSKINCPRAFLRVFQLPKLALFGLFFVLKRKP